jgi:hypothetical protein
MAITFDSSVTNEGGTPAAITGVIADIPPATSVADGTIYISTDTQEIFSAQAGSWINVSGGGGGSQNLDQVLAVGDTANAKNIVLNNSAQGIQINNTTNGAEIKSGYVGVYRNSGSENFSVSFVAPTKELIFINSYSPNSSRLYYANDNSDKNIFFVEQQKPASGIRKFEVNASYLNGNTITLTDLDTTNNQLCRFEVNADILAPQIQISLVNITDISLNIFEKIDITANRFFFNGFNGATQEINANIPLSGSTVNNLPDYSGTIANVNERIVQSGISLTGGNFDCDRYGAYQVKTASNTNDFDLTNFVNNGADGQFVTIMAEDTPIRCINTAGQIFGTANINSKGLFKLMKFANDIYTSHL